MTNEPAQNETNRPNSPLGELAATFLRLGVTSFGGPAAHIAMMEQDIVRRKNWLTHETFIDLLGATNLIPGPNSTEMAIHIGYVRGKWSGLIIAGTAFIVPATLTVLVIADLYTRYGTLPAVQGVLYGVKPVVIAIIAQALAGLGRTVLKTKSAIAVAILCGAAYLAGVTELPLLLATGIFTASLKWCIDKTARGYKTMILLVSATAAILMTLFVLANSQPKVLAFSVPSLFWYFVKIGSLLYGSGYVLIAYLRADLVDHWHWLTPSQLLDATAVGQITPGPVSTTATFIGYLLAGPLGAVVATVGIFLPAFIFVGLSGALVPHIRKSALAGAFLDGVNVASLVFMAVVTVLLGRDALRDVPTSLIALTSAVLLLRFQVNSAWLILGGAAIGMLLK